jgi:hypothetical protein
MTLRRNCCSIVGRIPNPGWLRDAPDGLAISPPASFAVEDSGVRTPSALVVLANSTVSFSAQVPVKSDPLCPSIILFSMFPPCVGAEVSPSLGSSPVLRQ